MNKEKQIEEMATTLCHQRNIVKSLLDRKCNDCHAETCDVYEICEDLYNAGYRKQSENVIELPCKIGDTVYIIDEADDECGEDYVLAVKVLQFFINEHGVAIELALPLGMRLNTWMVVGENVFLTEEEAEKALAKMKGGTK